MAITVPLFEPVLYLEGVDTEPDIGSIGITGGQTFDRGILINVAAGLAVAATSPLAAANSVIGLTEHAAASIYVNNVGGQTSTKLPGVNAQLFGAEGAALATGLMPGEPQNIHYVALHNGQALAMSIDSGAAAYAITILGTQAQIQVDSGGSGTWVVNPAGATKSALIFGESNGPQQFFGTVGDTSKRILVSFLAAAVTM